MIHWTLSKVSLTVILVWSDKDRLLQPATHCFSSCTSEYFLLKWAHQIIDLFCSLHFLWQHKSEDDTAQIIAISWDRCISEVFHPHCIQTQLQSPCGYTTQSCLLPVLIAVPRSHYRPWPRSWRRSEGNIFLSLQSELGRWTTCRLLFSKSLVQHLQTARSNFTAWT